MSGPALSGVAAGADTAGTPPVAAPVRWIGYALIACGLVILVLFAVTINPREFGRALRGARPELLVLAVAAIVAQTLVKGGRWRYMIGRLTRTDISPRFAAISIVAGVAAGSIVPARSFEMAKAMMLKGSYNVGLGLATSAMLVERVLDIVALIAGLLVAALLLPHRMVLASGLLLATMAVLVAAAALLAAAPLRIRAWARAGLRWAPMPGGVRGRAVRLADTLCESILMWRRGDALGVLAVFTAASAFLDFTRVCVVFWALGTALSPAFVAFTYAGAAMLGMALLIPGGVGVTEVSQVGLIVLLAPGAVAPVLARSAVLVDRVLSYYLVVAMGALILIAYHRYRHAFR